MSDNSSLLKLSQLTKIVIDSGDFELISKYKPLDATTNPSLIFKAAQQAEYKSFIKETLRAEAGDNMQDKIRALVVGFGLKILQEIPGRVSCEVDARLSFDTDAMVKEAHNIIDRFEANGVQKDRILIKIASTWEGICAAKILQEQGIKCNLTLLFSMAQAVACANANVTLISPFVGRILDWYKKQNPQADYNGKKDPGVQFVTRVFNYFKFFGFNTEIMGASFRNSDEITNLAGCDLLTISPNLLDELKNSNADVPEVLNADSVPEQEPIPMGESNFRLMLNEDAMATEKLAEGIRNFAADTVKLEELIATML